MSDQGDSNFRSRLDEFHAAVVDMPHGMRCATRLDSPDADCSCDRSGLLSWIGYVSGPVQP